MSTDASSEQQLINAEWALVAVLRAGEEWRPTDTGDAVLRLDGKGGLSGSNGCNRFGGQVRIVGERLEVHSLAQTMMLCPGRAELEQAFMSVLGDIAFWAVDDSELRLTTPDGRALVFTVRRPERPMSARGRDHHHHRNSGG